jgi:hypothetical protein
MSNRVFILAICLAIAVGGVFFLSRQGGDMAPSNQIASVSSFSDCVAAGYSVVKAFTEQCSTPDGRVFMNEVNNSIDDSKVRSYEDCIEAGYPKMDSTPPQCRTATGKQFVQGSSRQRSPAEMFIVPNE